MGPLPVKFPELKEPKEPTQICCMLMAAVAVGARSIFRPCGVNPIIDIPKPRTTNYILRVKQKTKMGKIGEPQLSSLVI